MIVPPGTICPPNALNPSRCAFESRPFLELPSPFLCAMKQLLALDALSAPDSFVKVVVLYFFFGVDFFAAAFLGAAFFLADAFAFAALVSPVVSAASVFTLGSR